MLTGGGVEEDETLGARADERADVSSAGEGGEGDGEELGGVDGVRVARERDGRGGANFAEDVADGGEVRVEGADDVAHAVGLRGAERGGEAGRARVRLARVVVVVVVAVDVEVGAPTRGVAVRAREAPPARHAEEHPEEPRDRAEEDAEPTRTTERRRRHRATRRAGASAQGRAMTDHDDARWAPEPGAGDFQQHDATCS